MSKKFKRLLKNIRFSVELEVEFPNTKDSQKLIAKHRIIRGWAIDYDGCFDAETLILTNRGWIYFKDLQSSDLVLSMNPLTQKADYYPIKRIFKKEYNRSMYELNTKTCSFKITPHHYLYGKLDKNAKEEYLKVEDIYANQSKFSELRIPRTFKWRGEWKKYKNIKISGQLYEGHPNHNKGKGTYKEYNISIQNWAKFMGYYFSEGYINEKQATITLTQAQNSKYNNSIRNVIRTLPFKNRTRITKEKRLNMQNCYQYNIYDRILTNELIKYGKHCYNKKIPQYIKEWNPKYINIFLQYYAYGDGHLKKSQTWCYSTTSKQIAYDLQELILKTGKYASIKYLKSQNVNWHDQYIVNVYNNKSPHFILTKNIIATENIEGNIYCVETEPYNLIYVMRNGTSYWSRNSLSNGAEYRPKDRNKLFWKEDCFDQIKEIIGLIKAHRGKIIPTTCGLHVHIDMSKFSNQEIINIIKAFIKKQPKIFRQFRIIPSRKDYAQRIPKKASNEVTMDVIKKLRTYEQLQYEEGFIGDRHYALNVLALNAHSTLEWRIFNGSLKINKIKEAIKFALQFCIKHAKG